MQCTTCHFLIYIPPTKPNRFKKHHKKTQQATHIQGKGREAGGGGYEGALYSGGIGDAPPPGTRVLGRDVCVGGVSIPGGDSGMLSSSGLSGERCVLEVAVSE